MNSENLKLHNWYFVNGIKYRYMGRTRHTNHFIFYSEAFEDIQYSPEEITTADIRPVFQQPMVAESPSYSDSRR